MMTLQEKNEVLGEALGSIHVITASFCRAADGASEEEKYDRGKSAFDAVVKYVASVVRHDLFGDEPSKKSWVASEVGRTLKMTTISMPRWTAIKYDVGVPELPRLTARAKTVNVVEGEREETTTECEIFKGNELFAEMTVYAGKAAAIRMLRGALKGAMPRFGKHRRMTANRQSREAAKKEGK